MDKKSIRKEIIAKRDNLLGEEKRQLDSKIKDILKMSNFYKQAKNIFIYIGFGSEINTSEYINEFLSEGKNVFVPRINITKKVMDAVRISSLEELKENKFGILEPDKKSKVFEKNELDLILVPGVAFNCNGGRVGYGGGYYDKYMKDINEEIYRIALCYSFQLIEDLPIEEHDIKVKNIITENGIISI